MANADALAAALADRQAMLEEVDDIRVGIATLAQTGGLGPELDELRGRVARVQAAIVAEIASLTAMVTTSRPRLTVETATELLRAWIDIIGTCQAFETELALRAAAVAEPDIRDVIDGYALELLVWKAATIAELRPRLLAALVEPW